MSKETGEFIAEAVQKWLKERGVGTLYIEPASPWENGYVESFNGTLREELLDLEEFGNVLEAKMLAVQWRDDYNHVRPPSSLEEATPAAFMESRKTDLTRGRRSDDLEVPQALGTPELTPRLS